MWSQVYNPLQNILISALVAAIPIIVLLGTLGFFHLRAHLAALLGLAASLFIATLEFRMPIHLSVMSALYGAAYGILPIGWIILNVIFLYQLTLEKGHFKTLQNSIAAVTEDRRLQLLLIAFSFGAFFEGAAGFGTPVAVTGAILIGIGFSPLSASALCLIANTAPVAFGAIGTPVIALAAVTGLDLFQLSRQIGPWLHKMVLRVPPLVPKPQPENAIFNFSLLSATGTGILFAALTSGFLVGHSAGGMLAAYLRTLKLVRFSLLTIACMLAIGFVTRFSGTDATLGLAFAQTGALYPMFGTLLGWLGVALTGSDTASNVLFGGLQKITAQQLGLNPVLMAAANSSGGVMGKMIDAQSIVVASTATRWYGHEGEILRFVFFHSIALAFLVGILVTIQAYLF
jgi:L-lactate permease